MTQIFFAVILLALCGIGGETAFRELFVKPAMFASFLGQSELLADASDLPKARHFKLVNIGNGLTPFCAASDSCFAWDDYETADMIVGFAPRGGIGLVRLLRACDQGTCYPLTELDAVFRPLTVDETLILNSGSTTEACTEQTFFAYDAEFCRVEEIVAGQVVTIMYGVSWERPVTLPASVKYLPLGHVRLNLVTRRMSGDQHLTGKLQQIAAAS